MKKLLVNSVLVLAGVGLASFGVSSFKSCSIDELDQVVGSGGFQACNGASPCNVNCYADWPNDLSFYALDNNGRTCGTPGAAWCTNGILQACHATMYYGYDCEGPVVGMDHWSTYGCAAP